MEATAVVVQPEGELTRLGAKQFSFDFFSFPFIREMKSTSVFHLILETKSLSSTIFKEIAKSVGEEIEFSRTSWL